MLFMILTIGFTWLLGSCVDQNSVTMTPKLIHSVGSLSA